jgi:NAD(P)-dependent dehydrogenase (short-subunit alcohol dehydrogenase family)
MYLRGRYTVLTGGAQELGMYMATALAEMGSRIAIADTNIGLERETAAKVGKLGVEAIAVQTDVTKKDQLEEVVD